MQPIPLIATEHVCRVAALLEAHGAPADRYLERARISPGVREAPSGFVPGRNVWALVGAADQGEHLGDFWLDIAQLSQWRRARWVRPMVHATTLLDALRTMSQSYVRQIPMNRLGLTLDAGVAWFWRRRATDVHDWPGNEAAEQYTLSFMLEAIRSAAGPNWLPEQLKVECSPSGWVATANRFASAPRIETNQSQLALAIPIPLLSLPVSITWVPGAGQGCEPPGPDLQTSLRQVLEPCLANGLPSQDIAAEMVWMNSRTLRRRLAEEGTSWREIVNDLKFARAVQRLQEGRHSMREISEELGYRDPAHFTRFFRSRAFVAPTAYRAETERGRELARASELAS